VYRTHTSRDSGEHNKGCGCSFPLIRRCPHTDVAGIKYVGFDHSYVGLVQKPSHISSFSQQDKNRTRGAPCFDHGISAADPASTDSDKH
jgi:hypothetical protein